MVIVKPSQKKLANKEAKEFQKLLSQASFKLPKVGDTVKGTVLSASKSEVRLDIDGIKTGVVRGRELYPEAEEYADLKPGDEVEATVIEEENENGEYELSFRYAGQEKAWRTLLAAYEKKTIIPVKVLNANKGGLLVSFRQISGFLPVSQLSPQNYPRVEGGDKGKILDKLKKFIGQEMEVKVITLEEDEDKIIFSEKEAWLERQQDVISKYKIGTTVEGEVTAVTNFGVFIKFGENLEGLIHISELAWQRIENPAELYKVGDKIKAEIINMDGSKIFLSAKKLTKNPWAEVAKKYKVGEKVKGKIIKINPFGLFVSLDDNIHGLAHINSLGLAPGQKLAEVFQEGQEREFTIISMEPEEHRLGLALAGAGKKEEKSASGSQVKTKAKDSKAANKQAKAEKTSLPSQAKPKSEKKAGKK